MHLVHVVLPTFVFLFIQKFQEENEMGGIYSFLVVEGMEICQFSRIKRLSLGASDRDDFKLALVIQFYLMTA